MKLIEMDKEDPFSLFCLLWKGIVINMLHLKSVLSIFTAFRKDGCGVEHWHLSADVPVGSGLGTVVLGNRQDIPIKLSSSALSVAVEKLCSCEFLDSIQGDCSGS